MSSYELGLSSAQFYILKKHVPLVALVAELADVAAVVCDGRIDVLHINRMRLHMFVRHRR